MSTAPGPSATGGWRRWLPSLVGLLLLASVAAVLIVRSADSPSRAAPPGTEQPAPDPTRSSDEAAALAGTFTAMSRAVAAGDQAAFEEAAGCTAWARRTWANLVALGIGAADLRFVTATPARAADTVSAAVEVTWAPGADGAYDGVTTVPREVTFSVRMSAGEPAVLAAGGPADRWVPVWLLDELEVTSMDQGAAVAFADTDASVGVDIEALTRQALSDVDAVLSGPGAAQADFSRQVVVVAPATTDQAAALLGRGGDDLEGIAAVTSTVDGSTRPSAPAQVVLNPAELTRLGDPGAQVVVSHEAAHAITGAAAVPIPLWVAEGFADWVALHDGSVPVDVAAARFLDSVQATGAPQALPAEADFAAGHGLGVTYEAAWTVFRALGRRAGDADTIGFYADVLSGEPVGPALESNTGLSVGELTRLWRTDVRELAGG